MKYHFLCLSAAALVGSLLAGSSDAQAQVNLKSISVGASYWKPSLDYWNERSMLLDYNAGKGATFSGSVMPSAAIEVGITKGLSLGGRVGYWQNAVSGDVTVGGTLRSEKLTLSIIPVSLDLKYTFAKAAPTSTTNQESTREPKDPFLTPYLGVSVARYFINNDFSRQVVGNTGSVNEKQSGSNYGVQMFVGAERKLVKKLYLAFDIRYHLGSYNQVVRSETSSTTQKVSLNGLEAGLSLKVKFN